MRDIDRRRHPSAPHEGGTAEDDGLVAVDVGHVLYREEWECQPGQNPPGTRGSGFTRQRQGEPRYAYEEDDRAAGHELDWPAMWPYTRVVFDLSRGERRVSLDLEPGYEQARVGISDAQGEVVDLLLRKVRSIELDRAKGREVLKVSFVDGINSDEVFLQLKPEISLGWEPFAII